MTTICTEAADEPKFDPLMECAPGGGQVGQFELTPVAGLPEDGSHDEASLT